MMLLLVPILLHGDRIELAYFWSSIVIVALPVVVFITIAVLAVRGYFRRRVPDGGGEVGPTPRAPSQSPPE